MLDRDRGDRTVECRRLCKVTALGNRERRAWRSLILIENVMHAVRGRGNNKEDEKKPRWERSDAA